MIFAALLVWVGTELSASWWYYCLLGVYALGQFIKTSYRIWKDARNGK